MRKTMDSPEIRPCEAEQQREDFLALPDVVYADDPQWIPTRESFPDGGKAFVAYEAGQPVARCWTGTQAVNSAIGTVGWFEALNRPQAANRMLNTAARHLLSSGARRIVGPMNGDTWHAYRLNAGPYEPPPFVKEPWNPSYYPRLWEAAGFAVAEHYDSALVEDPAEAAGAQEKFYRRCVRNGYTFREVTRGNYETMLPVIHDLSCRIFADNVLYTPIGLEEFVRMYMPAKVLLSPGLCWVADSADGTPAGYVFCFPDYGVALRAMRGGTGLAAKLRFLLNRGKAARTCLKTLGVVPETRGSGLTAALTHLIYKGSVALGYRQTLMCLMHGANDSHRFGGATTVPYRSYVLYERGAC